MSHLDSTISSLESPTESNTTTLRCSSNFSTYLQCVLKCVLSIDLVNGWISWLWTPVIVTFLLPAVLLAFFYFSSLLMYSYQLGLFRRLMKAASERDIEKAAKEVIATMWLVKGRLWFGYEVHGSENIPTEGPALLIYYHGALPIDYYYLMAHILLHRQRNLRSVVDRFLLKMPGLGNLLKAFKCTPGTVDECASELLHGHLLGLAPGGVYEAQFSDHNYKVLWKHRVGFAKIALKAKTPIIPVFTRNVREAFRSVGAFRWLTMRLYNKFRLPCVPLFGGFPVKLTTFVGKPIEYDAGDSPEDLRDKCKAAIEEMIKNRQRLPGSIFKALLERFRYFRPRLHDAQGKE